MGLRASEAYLRSPEAQPLTVDASEEEEASEVVGEAPTTDTGEAPAPRKTLSGYGAELLATPPAAPPASAPAAPEEKWTSLPLAATPPPPAPYRQPPTAEFFHGLNGARILASVHIVVGHLYQLSATSNVYFFAWGYTWVPWFFMLSGFVLTQSRLKRKQPMKPEKMLTSLQKRTAVIYPLYAFGLLLALLVDAWRGKALPKWYQLIGQAFLVQSWLPWMPERSVQMHCWFLSSMVPYWIMFDCLFRRVIIRLSMNAACVLLLLLSLPPWLAYVFPASLPGYGESAWYSTHQTGRLDDEVDYLVVILKFHPLCYLHVFVFGMVLARLRAHVSKAMLDQIFNGARRSRLATALAGLFSWGASLGYLGLLLVFNLPELRPPSYKISARLTVLMLLQGLVLVGLAPLPPAATSDELEEWSSRCPPPPMGGGTYLRDPVALLLSYSPAAWGNVSYAQYVLQFIAYALWPVDKLTHAYQLLLFFLFLLACSYLCSHLIIMPCNKRWHQARLRQLFGFACLVALVGAGSCAIDAVYWSHQGSSAETQEVDGCGEPINKTALPPAYVRVAEEAVDLKLNWSSVEGDYGQERVMINPSLLWRNGVLLRAARAHAISCELNEGALYTLENGTVIHVTEQVRTWHSDLAIDLGSAPSDVEGWVGWDASLWGLDGGGPLRRLDLRNTDQQDTCDSSGACSAVTWGPLCESEPEYYPENATVVRMVVSGAEDPKLVLFPASFASAAEPAASDEDSYSYGGGFPGRRLSEDQAEPEHLAVVFASKLPQQGNTCGKSSVYQMFQTVGTINASIGDTPAEELDAGSLIAQGGANVSSYHARATLVGCGISSRSEKNWISFTHDGALQYVYAVFPPTVITVDAWGLCQPQRYLDLTSSASAAALEALASVDGVGVHGSGSALRWDADRYLALFHTKDEGSGGYVTLAYMYSAAAPFVVLNVSRPLPLQGGNASFASSLAMAPGGGKVVVGYGVADAEARAFVMSVDHLLGLFDWSQHTCEAPSPPPPSTPPNPDRKLSATEWSPMGPSERCAAAGLSDTEDCSGSDFAFVFAYSGLVMLVLGLLALGVRRATQLHANDAEPRPVQAPLPALPAEAPTGAAPSDSQPQLAVAEKMPNEILFSPAPRSPAAKDRPPRKTSMRQNKV
jgi:peptidoglycan/LPS O-acetylase OafA/YrhL